MAGVACAESQVAVQSKPGDLIWTVRADAPAVTLAVGATQQLSATALTADGAKVLGGPAATFVSKDPSRVKVTPAGSVTAVAATTAPVSVTVSLTANGITLVDTVLVAVTPVARPIKTFAFRPDSTRFPQGAYVTAPLVVTDSSDAPVTGLAIKFTSLDTRILRMNGTNTIMALRRGKAKLVVSTMSYGVARSDTVEYTVTNPMTASVGYYDRATLAQEISPLQVFVGAGGSVTFYNLTGSALSVTFADTTGVVGGNLVNVANSSVTLRTFRVPGIYNFANQNGVAGSVVVLPAD